MRAFNNLRLLVKLAIPITILIFVAIGLVAIAGFGFRLLEDNTREIVDVSAARATLALRLTASIDEATIQEKNAILSTDRDELIQIQGTYEDARKRSMQAADGLIALSDTPQRKAINDGVKAQALAFFAMSERALERAARGETAIATTMSDGEVRALRRALMEALSKRVDANMTALADEKRRASALADTVTWTLIGSAAFGLVLAVALLGAIVVFGVTRPMEAMAAAMRRLAEGDVDVAVRGARRADEIGSLARSLQVFKENAVAARAAAAAQAAESEAKMRRAEALDRMTKRFEANVSALTDGLAGAAGAMEASARSLSAEAEQAIARSTAVSAAAGETAANVETVAAASEEMSASIQEIVEQAAQSSRMADLAVTDALGADKAAQRLSQVADRISDVVALITDIASQTNLLALNATIEAARAGEAGRGFAVVATEVKELAGQTARATDEIGTQIGEIQGATRAVVADIQKIARTIGDMSRFSAGIAAAMEEQGAATREIARNVSEASRGTQSVTANIGEVRAGADVTAGAAARVLEAARGLTGQSASLGDEVAAFLAGVKAA